MSQPLFLDPTITIEKVAYDIRIDDDPAEWPVAVVRESYKQLPFLKAYETEVELEKIDQARGYGVGKLLVWPPMMEKAAAAEARQLIVVPIVIRGKEMAPLDVYSYQGQMMPMDQDKVASILFKPETFTKTINPKDVEGTNLTQQLTPPNTDHQYNAGTLHKHGSVAAGVAGNVDSEALRSFADRICKEPGLRAAYETAPLLESVREIFGGLRKTASELEAERYETLRPTAIQFVSVPRGFVIKTANHNCYKPMVKVASAAEVSAVLPQELYLKLLKTGYLTITVDPVEDLQVKEASVATRFGTYRAYAHGRPVEGVIIPRVVDFDGNLLDTQLFIGSSVHGMQDKIASVRVGEAALPEQRPRGVGVFVYSDGDKAVATEPVRIDSMVKIAHGDGSFNHYVGARMKDGSPASITLVPGLQKVSGIGNDIMIPAEMKFVSLNGRQAHLLEDVSAVQELELPKTASVSGVEVLSDGATFWLRGPNAAVLNDLMDRESIEFALAALGIDTQKAETQELLKTAATWGSAKLLTTRRVIPESERAYEAIQKVASVAAMASGLPKVDCVKELALLTCPEAQTLWKTAGINLPKETADAVLALGFLTPENASIYVNYLSDLEKTAAKLAELLVASRLGMDDIRESAARNAMTQVNAVIRGLETLREKIT